LSRVYYGKLFRGGEAHVGGVGGDRMTRKERSTAILGGTMSGLKITVQWRSVIFDQCGQVSILRVEVSGKLLAVEQSASNNSNTVRRS
jgi:hypothetical protein